MILKSKESIFYVKPLLFRNKRVLTICILASHNVLSQKHRLFTDNLKSRDSSMEPLGIFWAKCFIDSNFLCRFFKQQYFRLKLFFEIPYALSFAVNKLWFIESKTFKRSINNVDIYSHLSSVFFYLSHVVFNNQ